MKWIFIILGILVLIIAVIYAIGSLMAVNHVATVKCKLKTEADKVWLLITDYKEYTRWRSSVKELTVDGTNQWTETNSHGDKVSYQLEVTDEKRKLITRILNKDLPYGGFWEFEIVTESDGCVVHITENGEVYNPLFRFMSKYVFGHEATLNKYMKDLQAELESR
jgi:hypothetical protein